MSKSVQHISNRINYLNFTGKNKTVNKKLIEFCVFCYKCAVFKTH